MPVDFEDREALEDLLSEQVAGESARAARVHILVPQRGDKRALLDLAGTNAKQSYDQRFRVLKPNAKAIQEELQDALSLPELPKRIECFDISHIQGAETVASMVVWEDGKMKKSDYRKFIIRTVEGVDDFASMREVVTRRYKRLQQEEKPMPSLVLIDGGLGQLHAAAEALESLEIINQPLAAIAKREEILYVYGQEKDPIALDHHSPGAAPDSTHSRRSPPLRRDLPSQTPPDARPLDRTAGDSRRRREHNSASSRTFRQRAGSEAGGRGGIVGGCDPGAGGSDQQSLSEITDSVQESDEQNLCQTNSNAAHSS